MFLNSNKYIDTFDDYQYLKMVCFYDSMNTEIKKHLFILIEKIEEDTIISFENLEDENLYL
jgi:hypothetical protein